MDIHQCMSDTLVACESSMIFFYWGDWCSAVSLCVRKLEWFSFVIVTGFTEASIQTCMQMSIFSPKEKSMNIFVHFCFVFVIVLIFIIMKWTCWLDGFINLYSVFQLIFLTKCSVIILIFLVTFSLIITCHEVYKYG